LPTLGYWRLDKIFFPSFANDAAARKLWARGERLIASPGAYQAMLETNARIDVRAILPQLRLPVLVLHSATDMAVPVANGRYLAGHIPGARYIEYPTGDHPGRKTSRWSAATLRNLSQGVARSL
jgi:pimeloyl-ACP methyl ester carboxylesterase